MGRKRGFPKSVRAPKRRMPTYSPPVVKPVSAVERVLEITELLEQILMSLPLLPVDDSKDPYRPGGPQAFRPQIQLFALQRVNRMFQATIKGSKSLQEAMTAPPLDTRERQNEQYLGVTAAEYGLGFARVIQSALEQPDFDRTKSWCVIKFNTKPTEPLYVISTKVQPFVYKRTDADTTWGEVMDSHHTGVLARCTAETTTSGE